MYAVVEFLGRREVELVPSNWLQSDTAVYWPPFRSTSMITKAIKERLPPDLSQWTVFKIRVLSASTNYEDGRRKLKDSEMTSDIQTDEDRPMGRGARKRHRVTFSDSDSDESEDQEIERATLTKRVGGSRNLPKTPAVNSFPVFPTTLPSTDTPQPDEHALVESGSPDAPVLLREENVPRLANTKAGVTSFKEMEGVTGKDLALYNALGKTQVTLEAIQEELLSQKNLLNAIYEGSPQTFQQEESREEQLPLDTPEAINSMEEKLGKTPDYKMALINRLRRIGGSSLKDAVRRVMPCVLSHAMALRFNWNGKSGWRSKNTDTEPKRAFGHLTLSSVIIRGIVKMPNIQVTEADVQREIMAWLRNAPDRQGGRKKRMLEK